MRCVDLVPAEQVEREGHTSKGNQPKWLIGGTWYKADHMGYESLAEIVVSRILRRSTVPSFINYEPVLIRTENGVLSGCSSHGFLGERETLIPLERLHRAHYGDGLAKTVGRLPDIEEKLRYTVDFVVRTTGLGDFGRYLATILELDAFILSEDRHTNNLAVIRDDDTRKFRLCPLFDRGLSLLSDTSGYPLDRDLYACIGRVRAKPFSIDFDEQAEAAVGLYGSDLRIHLDPGEIPDLLEGLDELYDARILRRAERAIREQMRKYRYLFP